MEKLVQKIIAVLSNARFDLQDEKLVQHQMNALFLSKLGDQPYTREKVLDIKNTIDFFFDSGLGIEVKINKGSRMSIYKQCERYCKIPEIKALLLVTARSMGLPKEINGKPCYYLNINKAWL